MIRLAPLAAAGLITGLLATTPVAHAQSTTTPTPPPTAAPARGAAPTVFARVNGKEIGAADFDRSAREAFRQKFYHGKPPEAEVQAMLRSIGQELIDKQLLAEEVNRRQIGPDMAAVEAEIAKYEKQYAKSENWQKTREQALPPLTAYLAERSRLAALEAQIRNVPLPGTEATRAFYKASPELFTEPEKVRVSQILIRVDAGSPATVWSEAETEAKALYETLAKGADFAEMARQRAADAAGDKDGDMGYVHRGMLSEEAHKQLDTMQPGQIAPPLQTLHGYALLKLTERQPALLRPFDDVAPRAASLLQRENAENAWQDFLKDLRSKAQVEINPYFSEIMQAPVAKDAGR